MTPASVNDTNYLPYCTVYSRHTKQSIEKVNADKGHAGKPNRDFLALNNIDDGIMRKESTTAKLTEYEKIEIKRYQKFDTLLSSILGSAIFTMALKEHIYRYR
jgi:transposase, IS5 family